jgi:hypothetical protein
MTIFKLAIGATAAIWPLLFLLASQDDPPQPPVAVPDALAERWLPDVQTALKADRLPLSAPAQPIPVQTVVVEAPAPVVVAAARTDVLQTVGATASARRHTEQDICARHGMHKVVTHGGRSWRCRR